MKIAIGITLGLAVFSAFAVLCCCRMARLEDELMEKQFWDRMEAENNAE